MDHERESKGGSSRLPLADSPAGEGLRWIGRGFGALGMSDDEILAREFVVYDALHAECKRQVAKR